MCASAGLGESVTVPVGKPHTLRNTSTAEVRLVNVHKPAFAFERFFRRFHALVCSGKLKLFAKDFGSLLRREMLWQPVEGLLDKM